VLSHTGGGKLTFRGDSLCKQDPLLQIDCNGIAQGYTVDLLADHLESRGVHDYLVELGGEIRLSGQNREGRPWKVGVEEPSVDGEGSHVLSRVLQPGRAAVTTSGSYRQSVERGGRTYSHIIDPATGHPIDNGMLSATIVASDAMTADALDNVCMVMGPVRSMKWLSGRKDVEAYLVYRGTDGRIRDTATAGFLRMSGPAD
jgi:thiamine biosynthesis lipoprotein